MTFYRIMSLVLLAILALLIICQCVYFDGHVLGLSIGSMTETNSYSLDIVICYHGHVYAGVCLGHGNCTEWVPSNWYPNG